MIGNAEKRVSEQQGIHVFDDERDSLCAKKVGQTFDQVKRYHFEMSCKSIPGDCT